MYRRSLRQMVRSCKECGDVVGALGFTKRQPFKFNLFYWMPEFVTAGIFRKIFSSRYAEVAYAKHAATASDEMEALTADFQSLIAQTSVPTPNFDRLVGRG